MKTTTAEMIGRADPVYAMTLAMLDQIENVTAELHRERSAQDNAFREVCERKGSLVIELSDLKHEHSKEIERLKAEHQAQIATLRANLADAHKELEQAIAERSALRAYAERGRDLVYQGWGVEKLRQWANEPLPTATQPTTA